MERSMRKRVRSRFVFIAFVAFGLSAEADLHADAPSARYVIGDTTVRDTKTGLEWQRHVDSASSRVRPIAYCQALTLAGGGWRAPNVKELLTLVDPTRFNPAMDPKAFAGESIQCCRSAQTYVDESMFGTPTLTMGVQMEDGSTDWLDDSTLVRCVR